MKLIKRIHRKSVFVLAFIVLLAGCQVRESIENDDELTSQPTIIRTATQIPLTASQSAPALPQAATVTKVLPTVTNTFTPYPPTATPTKTAPSTLMPPEESELLSWLMATNGGCELPCWWGIFPNRTQVPEVTEFFATQGVDRWSEYNGGAGKQLVLGYLQDDGFLRPGVGIRIYPEQGTVDVIHVLAEGYSTLGDHFVRDWQPYAASSMLAEYGVPTHIKLGQIPRMEPTSPQKYFVVLSYPGLGLEIQYDVFYERLNNTIDRVCFNLENVDHLAILLHSPDYRGELPVSLLPVIGDVLSWEDATGENTNEFYETLLKPGNDSCVELSWQ